MTEIIWAEKADNAAVADYVTSIIGQPGPRSIAVPGGKTPIPIFERLVSQPVAWNRVEVTLTDDRMVPITHPASNVGLLSQTLGKTSAKLRPLVEGDTVEPFDLVWLGMGADGHIASIFPNCDLADDAPPMVVRTRPDPLPPEAPFERLTLTMSALTRTRHLILAIRGEEKKKVLEDAVAGAVELPITRLIRAARCPILVFWSAA